MCAMCEESIFLELSRTFYFFLFVYNFLAGYFSPRKIKVLFSFYSDRTIYLRLFVFVLIFQVLAFVLILFDRLLKSILLPREQFRKELEERECEKESKLDRERETINPFGI